MLRSASFFSASAFSALTLAIISSPVAAQDTLADDDVQDGEIIVVTADRAILAALRGIQTEQNYDETDVDSYGSSTVGEFITEIMAQNGDEQPTYLVNGEIVSDIDDIADFPAEAIQALEVLPRGSSQRLGGPPNQRVYNLILRKEVRSATLITGYRAAVEGGWAETRAEAILTRIHGRDRLNLSFRIRDSDALFESDRNLIQPPLRYSAQTAGLLTNANLGDFRTLRPDSRTYEANLAGSHRLLPWLNTTISLRGRMSQDISASGLPNALFLLPANHPAAMGDTEILLLGFGSKALAQKYESDNFNANLLFNANLGRWQFSLTGQYDLRKTRYNTQRQQFTQANVIQTIPDTLDPYSEQLGALFAFSEDRAESSSKGRLLRFNSNGPILALPAGDLRGRIGGQLKRDTLLALNDTNVTQSRNRFIRTESGIDSGIDIPLASRSNNFLSALGELSLTLDYARSDVVDLGVVKRTNVGTLWQPVPQLSFTASYDNVRLPPPVETLADPLVFTENVRVLDVLTGETVDVTYLTGGNPKLIPTTSTTRRLAVSAAPWPKIALQLRADYQSLVARDLISFLPPASPTILRAFPERFLRDNSGRLVTIDSRPVNFDSHKQDELRYGLSFSIPLGLVSGIAVRNENVGNDEGSDSYATLSSGSRPRIQVTASHTFVLADKIMIRDSLRPIDLLNGGAIGIGGGRSQHLIDGSVAYTNSVSGIRITGQWRSASELVTGSSDMEQELRFSSIATFNLRAFTDLSRLAPKSVLLKSTRLTFSVNNITNQRQSVLDENDATPLRYQAAYRDPIGRTFELELRKVF